MKKINVIAVGLLSLSLLTGCTTYKIEPSRQDTEQEKVEKAKKEIASESKKESKFNQQDIEQEKVEKAKKEIASESKKRKPTNRKHTSRKPTNRKPTNRKHTNRKPTNRKPTSRKPTNRNPTRNLFNNTNNRVRPVHKPLHP